MKKSVILPVVTVVCLAIGTVVGHPIGSGVVDDIATVAAAVITAGVSIWGVFANHKKEE
jgi:uncharacterized protein YcfJ